MRNGIRKGVKQPFQGRIYLKNVFRYLVAKFDIPSVQKNSGVILKVLCSSIRADIPSSVALISNSINFVRYKITSTQLKLKWVTDNIIQAE